MAEDNQSCTTCDCPDGGGVVYCRKDAAPYSPRLWQRGSDCDGAVTTLHCNPPHNPEIVNGFVLDDEPFARTDAKQ